MGKKHKDDIFKSVAVVAEAGAKYAKADRAGTAGATISRDHETGRFHLCRQEPLATLDADSLAALVESFVNTLEIWRKAIASYRPAAEEAAARGEEVPALGLPGSGFISV